MTMIIATLSGRELHRMWAYPFWSFLPLALVMCLNPVEDTLRLRRFTAGFLALFAAVPLVFVIGDRYERLIRDISRPRDFPGRELAELITTEWRHKAGKPLRYVGGADVGSVGQPQAGEIAANSIAVYSPDRPHVIARGELALSPWVDREDLERQGVLLVWQAGFLPENVRANFPRAQLQKPLVLARRGTGKPEVIGYAFVLPQP